MGDYDNSISNIDSMEGHEFEHFVADLLRKMDYQKVEVTRGSGDQGVDILAVKDDVRYAIQCKCYTSDLGNTPIQEVNTGKMIYQCHVGIVVTNRYFTQSAKDAAKATGILLWDRDRLKKLIAQTQIVTGETAPTQQDGSSLIQWSGNPLMRRGQLALKDNDWKKAKRFFDRILDTDPENAEAYIGLVMAEAKLSSEDEFMHMYIRNQDELDANSLRHAEEFAGPQLKKRLAKLNAQQEEFKMRTAPIREIMKRGTALISGISGDHHIVGLRQDGTAVAVGKNKYGQCDVSNWTDIVAVSTGIAHTVGLKQNGTVVAAGSNKEGQCDVSNWTDITDIASGDFFTVGLSKSGNVVNTKLSKHLSSWTNIIDVKAGASHVVGLKPDGTVVADGSNGYGQCEVNQWTNIMAVEVFGNITVGLKSDRTVVATGKNNYGQCKVSHWSKIISVATGGSHTVGLKSDGTVVAAGDNSYGQCNVFHWTKIIAIVAGYLCTFGLKLDGSIVATGNLSDDTRAILNWKLFDSLENCLTEHSKIEKT